MPVVPPPALSPGPRAVQSPLQPALPLRHGPVGFWAILLLLSAPPLSAAVLQGAAFCRGLLLLGFEATALGSRLQSPCTAFLSHTLSNLTLQQQQRRSVRSGPGLDTGNSTLSPPAWLSPVLVTLQCDRMGVFVRSNGEKFAPETQHSIQHISPTFTLWAPGEVPLHCDPGPQQAAWLSQAGDGCLGPGTVRGI